MHQITITAPSVKEAIDNALMKLRTTEDKVDVKIIDQGKKGFFGMGSRLAVVKVTLKEQSALKILDSLDEKQEDKQRKIEQTEIAMNAATAQPEIQTEKPKPVVAIVQKSNEIQVDQKDDSEIVEDELEAIDKTKQFLKDIAKEMDVHLKIESDFDGRTCTIDIHGEHIAILIGKRGQVLNSLQYLAQLVANRYTDQFLKIQLDAEGYRARRNETLNHLAHKMAEKAVHTHREVALEPMPSYERKMIHAALSSKKKVKTYSTGVDPYRHIVITPVKQKKTTM